MQRICLRNNVVDNLLDGFDIIDESGNLAAGNGGCVRIPRIVSNLALAPGHGIDDFFKISSLGFDCQAFIRQPVLDAADRIHKRG